MNYAQSVIVKTISGITLFALYGAGIGVLLYRGECGSNFFGVEFSMIVFGGIAAIVGLVIGLFLGLLNIGRVGAAIMSAFLATAMLGGALPHKLFCHNLYGAQLLLVFVPGFVIGYLLGWRNKKQRVE